MNEDKYMPEDEARKRYEYDLINTAVLVARNAHYGQRDKAGFEYIFHPLTVALLCNTVEEKTVAILHDVFEDSEYTADMLLDYGFSEVIVTAINILTHDKDEPYEDYIGRIKNSGNKLAIAVKIADLTHNLDVRRMGKKPPKYNKYMWAKEYLMKEGV